MPDAATTESIRLWLETEDESERAARAERLGWLSDNYPSQPADYVMFAGWLGHALFEEARYSFAYAQYLGAALLGAAYIERVLAAHFYAIGRRDLERAGPARLAQEALSANWISQEQYDAIENIRHIRNPLAHFRAPLSSGTLEARLIETGESHHAITESDARAVLSALFRVLSLRMV